MVSATKEVELMQREELGDPRRICTLGQYSGASLRGRGMAREGGSLQYHGVHAALLALE